MHAYQQQLYGTLDDISSSSDHKGGSNIEFEEKAFNIQKDILNGEGMLTFPGEEKLTAWLIDIEIKYSNKTLNLSSSDLSGWYNALESFQQFHKGNKKDMYGAPIDYNLRPNAIVNLINKTK